MSLGTRRIGSKGRLSGKGREMKLTVMPFIMRALETIFKKS